MTNLVKLDGKLVSVEGLDSKSGKRYAKVLLEIPPPDWKTGADNECISLVAFGRAAEAALSHEAGELVSLTGRLEGRQSPQGDRWYINLVLEAIGSLREPAGAPSKASGVRQEPRSHGPRPQPPIGRGPTRQEAFPNEEPEHDTAGEDVPF